MSKKVKGTIFEPFYGYVQDQLNGRKIIMGNPARTALGPTGKSQLDRRYSNPDDGTNQEAFFAYTVEKQCFIRMMSGVDLDIKNADAVSADIDSLLELDLDENGERVHGKYSKDHSQNMLDELYLKHPMGLAKQYILEGGTRFYNDRGGAYAPGIGGTRTGFTTGKLEDDQKTGFSVGDENVRANAKDGFGAVPMPGIIDAEIRTVSSNGSLREAKVNFVCFNRRQLEVLELLYMRPGYMICLEWGWNPYIKHVEGRIERENNDYSIRQEFFNPNNDRDTLNSKIRQYKKETQGNFDGFIGFVKNFSFKAREDGGYNCSTEIIAEGAVLEFMTQQANIAKTAKSFEEIEDTEVEIEDVFLYALRSIDRTLNGDAENYKRSIVASAKNQTDVENEKIFQQEIYKVDTGVAVAATTNVVIPTVQNLQNTDFSSIQPTAIPQFGCDDPDAKNYDNRTSLSEEDDEYVKPSRDLCEYEDLNLSMFKEDQYQDLQNNNQHYHEGFKKVVDLYKHINGVPKVDQLKLIEETTTMGFGLKAIFDGTIIKRIVQGEGESFTDTGLRTQVFVRWDLVCQMINHLGAYPDFRKDVLYDPITEMTYLNKNQRTYQKSFQKGTQTDGRADEGTKKYYLSYEPPIINDEDPEFNMIEADRKKYGGSGNVKVNTLKVSSTTHKGKPHPLIGTSYDDRVCLLPHQPIFDELFESNKTSYDDNYADTDRNLDTVKTDHNWLCSYKMGENIGTASRNKIGLIYFNLEFLIETYETLRLKKVDRGSQFNAKYIKLNDSFNMFDYIEALWSGVNDACANYYKFTLTTEHERPNVARIIDNRFQDAGEEYFFFQPQGINSITRQFNFDSSITKDMASMISIAAQQPKNEASLEALSFKAFNKNIRHRFMPNSFKDLTSEDKATVNVASQQLTKDVKSFQDVCLTLSSFLIKLNSGHYDDIHLTGGTENINEFSHNKAKETAAELMKLRRSLQVRYPQYEDKEKNKLHPKRGLYITGRTPENGEIIPIRYNAQLDGIAGIIPYQVFKVDDTRLPFGYRRSDMVFVVFSEKHKITVGQDWTVEIGGQIAFRGNGIYDQGGQGKAPITKTPPIKRPKGTFDTTMVISGPGDIFIKNEEGSINPDVTGVGYPDPYRENASGVDITDQFAIGYGSQTWYLDENNNEKMPGIRVNCASYTLQSGRYVCTQCNIVDLYNGNPITQAQATKNKEIHNRKKIYPAMADNIKVPLSQNQFDAVVSYMYNVGTAVEGSPSFYRKLNQGDYEGAADEMDVVTSGGQVLEGLVKRRAREQTLFRTGNYNSKKSDWTVSAPSLMGKYGYLLA